MDNFNIPNTVSRYEIRYSKLWAKVEQSKILFASECSDDASEEQAKRYWKTLLSGMETYPITEVVKSPKDMYSELYLYKVYGIIKQDEFHSTAYYTQKRVYVRFRDLQEKMK